MECKGPRDRLFVNVVPDPHFFAREARVSPSQELDEELSARATELRQAHQALELKYSLARILAESATPMDATSRMLRAICESTVWPIGAIWIVDPLLHVLYCVGMWHAPGSEAPTFSELTRQRACLPGEGLPGRVLQSGEAHWVADLAEFDNLPRTVAAATERLCSAFGLPILLRGEVMGVVELLNRDRREPEPEQIRLMSTIGTEIGLLIERTRTEEALRESETRFRTLAETASDAIITIDATGTIVFVNAAAEHIFGHRRADLIGEELTVLMPDHVRQHHRSGLARYQETGQRHISWKGVELPGRHRDGHEIPLEISFGEFSSNGQRYFTGIIRDISERKRAEKALRRSRDERLVELERVRQRIAADLHDDVGSSLTQIAILSEVIQQRTERADAVVTKQLSMIAGASRELVDAMSDIVWAINPQKDHLHDLTQRMRRFAADTFTARNISVRLRLPDRDNDVRLGANLRREVFLIFKEVVNNIVRHSGCTQADIHLSLTDGRLELRLSDNGHGFDVTRDSDGHGLVSMRARARGVGGKVVVNSLPGQGTTIHLDVPLSQPQPVSESE